MFPELSHAFWEEEQFPPPGNGSLVQQTLDSNNNGYIYEGSISLDIEFGQDKQGLGSGHWNLVRAKSFR